MPFTNDWPEASFNPSSVSAIALGWPGRLMIRQRSRITATWRDRMAVGTNFRLICRICSPNPGISLCATANVASGVTSRSAGPGTRKNIDEFTRTTAGAVEKVGCAAKGKAIIIINPAEPPLVMRDTVHCLTETAPDQEKITASILDMIKEVQKYVPGYRLVNGPVFEGNRISIYLEVQGLGDFLPTYAGNLDIMTAAGARTAEMFAEEIIKGTLKLERKTEGAKA